MVQRHLAQFIFYLGNLIKHFNCIGKIGAFEISITQLVIFVAGGGTFAVVLLEVRYGLIIFSLLVKCIANQLRNTYRMFGLNRIHDGWRIRDELIKTAL